MTKNEAEQVLKDTIEYANEEIKKNKKRYLKRLLILFVIFIVLVIQYLLIFKYEKPLEYSKDILEVIIPEDQGIDIVINLKNYKNVNALLVKIDDNSYDLYINITQTLATKIFDDNDKSNNLLRIGNNMIVDFQSGNLRGFMPNENNYRSIKHIYYIDNLSRKIMSMNDIELINYSGKTLIWERDI